MSSVDVGRERGAGEVDPGRVMLVCTGVTFMAFLDYSVVNIAFPEILKDFTHTSLNTLTWIVSGYAVTFAALLALGGRIADSIGRRTVFLWSLVGFTVASAGCGWAPNVGWLVAARFLQGAAAGGMVPAALGLILSTTPRERIPRAIALWTTASGFSAVIGPAVGGVLLRLFGWRSVFLINLPVGVILLVGGLTALPRHVRGSGDSLPDPLGSAALGLGVAGVVTTLTEANAWGWRDARTIGLGIAGLIVVLVSVLRSRRHPAPAIDVEVWRNPAYKIANLGLGLLSATLFAWMLGAPLFATTIWHWSVLETAGALCVGGAASMAGALSAGRVKDPATRVKAAMAGCLLFAGSNAIWASGLFGSRSNFWSGWLPGALLGGGGLGLALTCLSTVAAGTIAPVKFAGGLGMLLSVRQIGGAVGVAGFAIIMAASAGPGSVSSYHHVFEAAMAVDLSCVLVASSLFTVLRPSSTAEPALAPGA